ncbi:MAG: hypothetical protein JWM10_4825, partial [Myxococcaceae bacterium]|nr:hypothetical protein [Myxococcaceae bacterium]
MPFAVVITRLAQEYDPGSYRTAPSRRAIDPSRWLPPLAERLGVAAYDLRLRLTGESPWVIATLRLRGDAEALTADLRAAGFGAVCCDVDARPWASPGDLSLALDDEGLSLAPGGARVAYAAVALVVVATLDAEHGDESIERVVRAPRQGVDAPVIEVSRFSYARKRQRVMYLRGGAEGVALRFEQDSLRTTGVAGLTSRERFDRVVAAVRARCPGARFDERFVEG